METQNAADSIIKGLELEMAFRPVGALTITSSIAYLNAEFDQYMASDFDGNPVDVSGNVMPVAPEWSANITGQYVLKLADYGFITLRGEFGWQTETYFDQFERDITKQGSYSIVNVLLSFETADGRWRIDAHGRNLGDEEYYETLFPLGFVPEDVQGQTGTPRIYGLQVTYAF
ncbi:MAG: TonB-dependent receptor [Deltaproteobacteria bacterium]|nr:TonB-dependent receptor [Deltaproteobacteria bacterium]